MRVIQYFQVFLAVSAVSSFTLPTKPISNHACIMEEVLRNARPSLVSPLFMGRAAAVRAATKGKSDAKKAKVNAVFGKKIIMAVKQGGSPDPNANRALGDLIKQAKAASVPVDVSDLQIYTVSAEKNEI